MRGEIGSADPGNAERKLLLNQMRGITPPEKLTKKQRQIWEYMKFHPKETNLSVIARGAGVNRHTVAKWYGVIQEMLRKRHPTKN